MVREAVMGNLLGNESISVPLILGGHSFFSSLGNDPVPDEDAQAELVAACLDSGIRWFDTTHQPERSALGKALARLGRRDEATILAWNFLEVLAPGGPLDRPIPFEERHLQMMLDQLQTDHLDLLVLHEIDGGTMDDRKRLEEFALKWQEEGVVRELGCWAPGANAVEKYGRVNPYAFMVRPYSLSTADAAPAFAACKVLGWRNFACSPFGRGWELDKMVDAALHLESGDPVEMKARVADHMLRYSLYQPNVDKLINAIRKREWIAPNIASVKRGPLSDKEIEWLRAVKMARDVAEAKK